MSAEFGPTLPQATFTGQTINPEATRLQGDFAHFNHSTKLYLINKALGQYGDNYKEALTSDNGVREKALERKAYVSAEVAKLQGQLADYREFVDRFPAEVKERVTGRYAKAKASLPEDAPMNDKIAARLAEFNGVQIIADVDKTITLHDKYLPNIPGSHHAEKEIKEKGRDIFPEALVRYWREAMIVDPEAFADVGRNAPLRPGVPEFFKRAKESGVKADVLSANFMPLVEGVLEQIPDAEGANVWAVTHNNVIATDKGTVLKHNALMDPEKAVIFIGDGNSDIPALEAASTVAVYFALDGSSFAKELEDKKLPYITYRDFNDINVKLEELGVLKPVTIEQTAN